MLKKMTKVAADDLLVRLSQSQQRYEDDLRELHRKQTLRIAERVAGSHRAQLLVESPKTTVAKGSHIQEEERTDRHPKIAIVTGAGRGVGLAIVKGLCKSLPPGSTVVLTCRNPRVGLAAVEELKSEAAIFSDVTLTSLTFSSNLSVCRSSLTGSVREASLPRVRCD